MQKIKIGIVEDDLVIADTIDLMLRRLGYDTTLPCINYKQAIEMVEKQRPDLLLLDIHLAGTKDGIDVAVKVRDMFAIPIIFLTANSDAATVSRAKAVKPNAYLVKPFTKEDLYAAIEIATANFYAHASTQIIAAGSILVKDGYKTVKIYLDEINFLQSKANYVVINTTEEKKIIVRSNMAELLEQLGQNFVRTHRSYAINMEYIKSLDNTKLRMDNGVQLTVAKSYKENLISSWNAAKF